MNTDVTPAKAGAHLPGFAYWAQPYDVHVNVNDVSARERAREYKRHPGESRGLA